VRAALRLLDDVQAHGGDGRARRARRPAAAGAAQHTPQTQIRTEVLHESLDTGQRPSARPQLRISSALVTTFRIREAAELLGVSDDTVRRWADAGRVPTSSDAGRRVIDGADLARFAEELAASAERPKPRSVIGGSARNRFTGLVTKVLRDTVMAQVEIQAGPHRIVSLMSREAADELELEPGVIAIASVKATNVVIEVPEHRSGRGG
jgi:molybdopterin-binding protein